MGIEEDRTITPDAEATPSHQGSSGGTLATTVGARDEEENALEGTPEPTGVDKADKVQPTIPTRADHEGAAS